MSELISFTKPNTEAYFTQLTTEERLYLLAGLIADEIRKDIDSGSPLLNKLRGGTHDGRI